MAEGHARTVGGIHNTVEINGKKYTLSPFNLSVYPEMESYVISRREDPMVLAVRACKVAPPDMHETIWKTAMASAVAARSVTSEEMNAFEDSIIGVGFKFWICIRDNHPEINSPDKALAILLEAGQSLQQEIQMKLAAGSGEADLGNSTGPPEEAKEGK